MLSSLCRERSSMLKIKCFCSSSHLIPLALPSQRETHFWYIVPDEVKDTSLLSQYLNVLSPFEKEDVSRMQGEKLQKSALLARTLVRTTLARYTDSLISPSALRFRKNIFGKPEVEWQCDKYLDLPSLQFNLSHTSSLIACGVTVDMPIGIDVEEKQRKTRNSVLSFARRYFSPNEVEYLLAFPDPEIQRLELIKLWTLKEAYVKALGRGFSAAPFKTFTIRFRATNRCSFQMPGDSNFEYDASEIAVETLGDPNHLTTNWKFALLNLENSHYAAICVEKKTGRGEDNEALKLKVWKTYPLVKDVYISGTDSVRTITGHT